MRSPTGSQTDQSDSPANGHRRSLRSKLVLALVGLFLIFIVVDECVRQKVILPGFESLETSGAIRDSKRIIAALDVESEHLQDISQHLAKRPSLSNAKKHDIITKDFDAMKYSWIAVMNDNQWDWSGHEQMICESDQEHLKSLVSQEIENSNGSFRTIIRLPSRSLMMVVGSQSESKEASRMLIIGRAIDHELVDQIRRQTQIEFSIQMFRNGGTKTKSPIVWEASDSTLVVETPLRNSAGVPIANVFMQAPRDITQRSKKTTDLARNLFIMSATAAMVFLLLLLQRIIIAPLNEIRKHTERIAVKGLDGTPLEMNRSDEIGDLAGAFQRMTENLADTQNQLADASHAAGMSQVADTVIHNIGNVLTNVNSLLDTTGRRIEGLRIEPLTKLASRLEDPNNDDRFLQAAPGYLDKLACRLHSDRDELTDLVSTLGDNLRHIHDVVRDQRRHAINTINETQFAVGKVLHEAVACCQARLDAEQIEVTVDSDSGLNVNTDRSLLLQIVINIIGNARQAFGECENRRVAINAKRVDDNIQISFVDSGCGMSRATLDRIFEAHFTTKSSGSGLGLHFCAIAMKKMNGSISASSDGPGLGSSFVLTLPSAKSDVGQSASPNLQAVMP